MTTSSQRYTLIETHDLDVAAMVSLYDSVGWCAYTCQPEIFPRMLAAASHVIAAHDDEDLVGIVRVVGDGVTIAVIQDLIVHPDHQRHGLGSELLQEALRTTSQIRQTYITTDDAADNRHVVNLYEKHGFRRNSDEGLVTLGLFR